MSPKPVTLTPLLALQRIKSNAEFAQLDGALFDLQRCVELCDAALSAEPQRCDRRRTDLQAELRNALSFLDEAVAGGQLNAAEVAEQFADARALLAQRCAQVA